MPPAVRGLILSANLVFSVLRLVQAGCPGQSGWGDEVALQPEEIAWTFTGMDLHSACRWLRSVILTHPVAILRAAFCAVCRLFQFESLTWGVKMGAQ